MKKSILIIVGIVLFGLQAAVAQKMEGINWTLVEQPAAQALFDVDAAQNFDAFVMYDMPGIQFDPRPGEPPNFLEPSAACSKPGKALTARQSFSSFITNRRSRMGGW